MTEDPRPIDVWLHIPEFEEDGITPNDEAEHEANTYHDNGRYRVDWCNTAVGLVTSYYADTYAEAIAPLERDGYENYTDNTSNDYAPIGKD